MTRTPRAPAVAGILAIVVALPACAGGSDGVPATSARATTTVAAQDTAPAHPAAAAYLDIAQRWNDVVDDLNAPYADGVPDADMIPYCAELEAATRGFVDALAAASWPADVQDEIDAQIAAETAYAEILGECASAGSGSAAAEIWESDEMTLRDDASYEAATSTRVALGLPVDR